MAFLPDGTLLCVLSFTDFCRRSPNLRFASFPALIAPYVFIIGRPDKDFRKKIFLSDMEYLCEMQKCRANCKIVKRVNIKHSFQRLSYKVDPVWSAGLNGQFLHFLNSANKNNLLSSFGMGPIMDKGTSSNKQKMMPALINLLIILSIAAAYR